jgi:general secretion pathway protein J
VAYELDDDRLIRLHWFAPDHTLAEEPVERELLSGVREFRLRFFSGGGWTEEWPPGLGGEDPAVLPMAIEVTLELEDLGEIYRLIEAAY